MWPYHYIWEIGLENIALQNSFITNEQRDKAPGTIINWLIQGRQNEFNENGMRIRIQTSL